MAELQASDDRNADHRSHVLDHGLQVVAVVIVIQLAARKIAEHECLLLTQDARQMQLIKHPLDTKRLLVDVFDKQHAALHRRHVRRADERRQHRQIAAPQGAGDVDRVRLWNVSRDRHAGLCQRGPEVLHREFADVFRAEVAHQHRPAERFQPGAREERQLDRREVAMADERDRLIGQPALQPVVIEAVQETHRAVSAAHGQHNIGQRGAMHPRAGSGPQRARRPYRRSADSDAASRRRPPPDALARAGAATPDSAPRSQAGSRTVRSDRRYGGQSSAGPCYGVGWGCWLRLLAAVCWLRLLVAVVGCGCWLRLLAAVVGCGCWLRLLVAVVGCGCWLRLLVAVVGCGCWLRLLVAVVGCGC